ncbi:MAG: hypothetical protein FIA90_12345 [candidate division NC10 bacterium]|nr:hypothetical protein [candidate division NC10 bacterium]
MKTRLLLVGVLAVLSVAATAFAQSPVLVKGQPPLTEETVGRLTEFFEWAFDVYLTNEQRQVLRNYAVDAWKQRKKSDTDDIVQLARQQVELSTLDAGQRALVRMKIEPELLDRMRKQPNEPMARWALGVYEASHRPIAGGTPPLTRQSTDAYLETLFFMVGEVSGQHSVPDRKQKDDWAQALAAGYPKMSAEQKQQIAGMPLLMATLRVSWPMLSESEKAQYRTQWAGQLKPLLPAPAQTASPAKPAGPGGRKTAQQTMAEQNRRHQATMDMNRWLMDVYKKNYNIQSDLFGGPYRYE